MTNKNVLIGLVVVLIIAIGGYVFPGVKEVVTSFSGQPFLETQYFQQGLSIGNRATVLEKVTAGTGSLIYSNSSVTATTTKAFDIAVTGVTVNDNVFVQAATTTAIYLGWDIIGASASTTSGYITLIIANNTGGTANVPRNIASSTNYLIIRD